MPAPLSDVEIPMVARISLGHAVVEHVARGACVDLLHIKGPATNPVLRPEGRFSSDVDVLVRPDHVNLLMAALQEAGFEVRTHFETGSIFRHAANLHHHNWGWVDVHRAFPGIDIPAAAAFDRLWRVRVTAAIAAYDVPVPALLDQALLIVLHGARDTSRGQSDVEHLRTVLSAAQWVEVVTLAKELRADVAFAAGTGDLDSFSDRPEHDLWKVASQGGTRLEEWRARLRAARTRPEKIRLITEALFINSDHLRMELGRQPSIRERLRAQARRPAVALAELKSVLASRRGRVRR
ncbi:MAG: nucleotidyltransferase family protein [Allobranchiibius sp.]